MIATLFKDKSRLIIFAIFILGLFLRLYHLEDRALHHDESLHGVYSLYYLLNPKLSYYKYNPLLHGPFLYHIIPWFYWIIDISKWSLRLPAAILGSLFIITPIFFRRYLSKNLMIFASLLIALGPTFVYWSRFIRHDTFVFFSFFLALISFRQKPYLKMILLATAAGVHFTSKENFFVHLLFFITFSLFEFFLLKLKKSDSPTLISKMMSFTKNYPYALLCGLGVFIFIATFYYSSGYVYPQGILDGLYRKSLTYWANQHSTERIPGPFIYTFLINSLYESWWLPAIIMHLFFFYREKSKKIILGFVCCFIPALIFQLTSLEIKESFFMTQILKVKINLDLYLFFPLIYHSIIGTSSYLLQNKKVHAYTFFFFTASLFTYSFLGEKVPWLALYPLMASLIFFAIDFSEHLSNKKVPLLYLIIPKVIFNLVWCNYLYPSESKNLLSQVHTTREFESTLESIREEMDLFPNGQGPLFLAKDGHTWPTTWYLTGRDEYQFHYTKNRLNHYKYILTETTDGEALSQLKDSHSIKDISYRSWFLPEYENLTLFDYLKYWTYFGSNQKMGQANLRLFIKTNL